MLASPYHPPEPIGQVYKTRKGWMVLCRIKKTRTVPKMSLDGCNVIGWMVYHDWIVKDILVSKLPLDTQRALEKEIKT